ncbi:glycosyltransferase family 8 protein [Candidatus Saccharibacteria bacterium]|nr:glycosyltransferase family 8 protein [Candidatus Saccharibacteria bacterium]
MNILYCGDKGIARGVLISILSILKYNKEVIRFYILTINYEDTKAFTKKAADYLNKLVKKTNQKSFVKLIDATEVFVKDLPKKNMGSYFTPCSMLRLYIDKVPELNKLDRILYLDYDVVCRGDLADFYNTDMDGVEAAGVLDIYGKNFYHYHGLFNFDYMNSGVMLFNISECLKSKMFEKAVKLCMDRWMMLADQAALNKSITHRKILPRKYNEQAERPKKDTVLHHFSNNFKFLPHFHVQKVKPFEVEKIHEILKIHEYDDILDEYLRQKKYVED